MIGDQKLKNVMDVLLNDELYFSIYKLIERFNNFRNENNDVSGFDGLNNIYMKHALMDCEVWRDTLHIRYIQASSGSASNAFELRKFVTEHPENFFVANRVIIQGNAQASDISPIKEFSQDSSPYDKLGWYVHDFSITDEMEAELFQASTIDEVYSPYELQEILNRASNLPLCKHFHLTILPEFMYNETYKNLDKILRGY